MNPEIQILVGHVIQTLPTDVHQRRQVLNALLVCLAGKPVPSEVRSMLGDLDRHMARQTEFVMPFSGRGSGRLADDPIERGAARLGDEAKERGGRR